MTPVQGVVVLGPRHVLFWFRQTEYTVRMTRERFIKSVNFMTPFVGVCGVGVGGESMYDIYDVYKHTAHPLQLYCKE